MEFFQFMFVPTILFVTVVAPIWLTMHYRSVNQSRRSLTEEDRESLEHMLETVDKLVERIAALEAILDADHGNWRTQTGRDLPDKE
ncbi:MAG: envelope stress response membrane protein PspB [Parahaliea sp.]